MEVHQAVQSPPRASEREGDIAVMGVSANPAREKAVQEVGGKVAAPIFTDEERAKGLMDFNDLHKSRDLDEVKRQMDLVQIKGEEQEKSRDKGISRGLSL